MKAGEAGVSSVVHLREPDHGIDVAPAFDAVFKNQHGGFVVTREGVHYRYKTNEGFTRSIRLFDIPSLAEKLKFMGPGEAFIDTDLTKLYLEIADLQQEEA